VFFAEMLTAMSSGGADDPIGQRIDEAARFGERDELIGRDNAARRVAPAHQRLDRRHPPGAAIELGLVL
jgi:hypothetical protein